MIHPHCRTSGARTLRENEVPDDRIQKVDTEIDAALRSAREQSLPTDIADLELHEVLRYHLGRVDENFNPVAANAGKRVRPLLAILSCEANGGDASMAMPLAASIELLHNFTLIHDDIQDRSTERRHRPTVWSTWGVEQAINAGDAMFAISHLALHRLVDRGVPADQVLRLSSDLHNTTLRIVEGQALDIGFETRHSVTTDEYLTMIGGKTVAIIRFACSAGAIVAGADSRRVATMDAFGNAIGVAFQIQDDLLGAWGASSATGKPVADDIRQSKKTYPLLLLFSKASQCERDRLSEILSRTPVDDPEVDEILEMLQRYEIRDRVEREVERNHDEALALLDRLGSDHDSVHHLRDLVNSLTTRDT